MPCLVLGIEFETSEVTENAGHDNRAIAPLSKVEGEFVVFDVLVAWDVFLRQSVSVLS